jgi:outer membrane protein assembly factor BamB
VFFVLNCEIFIYYLDTKSNPYTKKCIKLKENERMTKSKKTIATAMLLIAVFAISIIAMPTVTAQTNRKKTYAYIGAMPNPVGVGQEVLLHIGITEALSLQPDGWEGLTVTVKDPDGNTKTLGEFRTDSTGGTGYVFVPDKAGNYTLQTNFPEQVCVNGVSGLFGMTVPPNTVMEASKSDILTLVVQEEPVQYYPGFPMPTEYWTRPFDAQHREWATISGSWLETPVNYYAPFNDGPETAHVLWAMPFTSGGTVGGALDNAEGLTQHSFEMGDAYEGKFGAGNFGGGNPLIIAGKLYYEKYAGNDRFKETVCVDLHTGEVLWSRPLLDNRTFTRGQLMYWDTYDYHGVYDYLWVEISGGFDFATFSFLPGKWYAFDPFTGDLVYTINAIPSGSRVRGPNGEFLIYTVDTQHGWMTLWNSSNIPQLYASVELGQMGYGQWQPMGKTVNATEPVMLRGSPYSTPNTPLGLAGYHWNKTIQTGLAGSVIRVQDDRIIGGSVSTTAVRLWALNLNSSKGAIGNVLFDKTWTPPSDWVAGNLTISTSAISSNGMGGVLTLWSKEERKYYGFSTESGDYLWKTDDSEYYLQIYVATTSAIVDDKLYSSGASGVLYCYNAKTGDKLWEYHATDTYSEILWANDWWNKILFITDGKIYIGHEEHSPIDPRPRGAPFICLNATTGDVIWRVDGLVRQTHWGGHAVIGDSIIATQDTYDQRVYGIGKGPSATTVSASPKISVHGSSVLVEGIVTDISPGTEDYALRARFPNGVPAVADESMSDWMLYVYKQFPRPTNASGVEVTLDAIDPNNNFVHIGTATSDSSGTFGYMWEPEVPGKYTVIATFAGSGAYYASFAETTIGVEEAPEPTQAPTPTPMSVAEQYFIPATVGMIIAIVAVGAVLALLMLRKRP